MLKTKRLELRSKLVKARLPSRLQPSRQQPGGCGWHGLRFATLLAVVSFCCQQHGQAQSLEELPAGFAVVSGTHIDVITDMPLSDELRQLPRVFDAAMPQWYEVFDIAQDDLRSNAGLGNIARPWHVVACVMLDRQRFIDAGLLPTEISTFQHGFQQGDRLWVSEQPSDYYRRHLLLHEGTHWMMWRKYGSQGPPWLAEGMAEWMGTHRWNGQELHMGIMPTSRDEVPYWGRTKLIQEQLATGVAPTLETILRYSNTAHQQTDAYAWSWAAVVFLKYHPDTADVFAKLLQRSWRTSDEANRWLFQQLRSRWPEVREQWQETLGDLDYGFDVQRGLRKMSRDVQPLNQPQTLTVDAADGWQSTGLTVPNGAQITIEATGEYIVGQLPQPWRCTPAGVSLEYYRGQPLGRLMMTTVTPLSREPQFSKPLVVYSVGSGGAFTLIEGGEVLMRINESLGGMADNSGTLRVTIAP